MCYAKEIGPGSNNLREHQSNVQLREEKTQIVNIDSTQVHS